MPFSFRKREEAQLVVGLGNPGAGYRNTRHNAGALAVEKFARGQGLVFKRSLTLRSLVASKRAGVLYATLPQTFMNRSGSAVAALARKKGIAPSRVLVVCDDVALKLGDLRMRVKGSSGGHKGLGSVIEALGTQEVPRLRLGVGPGPAQGDLAAYVLENFEKSEKPLLEGMIVEAVEAIGTWVREGIEAGMNRSNTRANVKEGVN